MFVPVNWRQPIILDLSVIRWFVLYPMLQNKLYSKRVKHYFALTNSTLLDCRHIHRKPKFRFSSSQHSCQDKVNSVVHTLYSDQLFVHYRIQRETQQYIH